MESLAKFDIFYGTRTMSGTGTEYSMQGGITARAEISLRIYSNLCDN